MVLRALRVSLATTLVLAAAACGGAPPEPATPPPAPAAPPAAPTAEAAPVEVPAVWTDGMPKPVQIAFMKKNVMPRMSKAFQAHDATRYAVFDCKTCHGPAFQEPKEFLPRLTFKDGKITSFAEKPEISKFMHEVVVPEMAASLGKAPYDEKTGKGFGCGGCHGMNMK